VLTTGLVAACLGYFMIILDTTIVNVALPPIRADLGTDLTGLQWVVDSYLVVLAAGILSGGSLSDRYSARAVFRLGIALFALASAACGLAPTTGVLIASRAAQGAAAALCVPSSLALVRAGYDDPVLRRKAVAMWGVISGVAAAAGPVLGGIGVEAVSWRLVFFVNVPIGLLVLFLTTRHVPRGMGVSRRFDAAGQALAILALGALAVTLIEVAHDGLAPIVWAAAVVALVSAFAFLAVERRVAEPMLPLGLFREHAFAGGAVIGVLINFAFYGELFVINLYFQDVRGHGALAAGLAVLPQLGAIVAGSTIAARRSGRASGPRRTGVLGLWLCGTGTSALLIADASVAYVWLIVPMAAAGLGMGMITPAVTAATTEAAPVRYGGLASGVINASRQAGSVIGIAVLGGLAGADFGGTPDAVLGIRYAIGAAAIAFFLASILAALYLGRAARHHLAPDGTDSADHDEVAAGGVLAHVELSGDPLAELGDVADDADDAASLAQPVEDVHHLVEGVRVEAAEPLVDEQGLEARAPRLGTDHVGQAEREREAGQEGLAPGQRRGVPIDARPAVPRQQP
jgi:DHA2 family methylenomycin A resistance protein-like MFS transporter